MKTLLALLCNILIIVFGIYVIYLEFANAKNQYQTVIPYLAVLVVYYGGGYLISIFNKKEEK